MNLQNQRTVLLAYLRSKVESCDWHGVSDAANDLRVLEAQIALTPSENSASKSPTRDTVPTLGA